MPSKPDADHGHQQARADHQRLAAARLLGLTLRRGTGAPPGADKALQALLGALLGAAPDIRAVAVAVADSVVAVTVAAFAEAAASMMPHVAR